MMKSRYNECKREEHMPGFQVCIHKPSGLTIQMAIFLRLISSMLGISERKGWNVREHLANDPP